MRRKIFLLTLITLFAIGCNEDVTGNGGDSGGTTSGGTTGGNSGGSTGGNSGGGNSGGSSGSVLGTGFDSKYAGTWTLIHQGITQTPTTLTINADGSLDYSGFNFPADKITKNSDNIYTLEQELEGYITTYVYTFDSDTSGNMVTTQQPTETTVKYTLKKK